jgi:hypothetical protein
MGRRVHIPVTVRAAAALALLGAAAAGVGSTEASFTDAASAQWSLRSGSLAIAVADHGFVLDGAPLAPGDVAAATVAVTSTGTLGASVRLTRDELASTAPAGCALRDALTLRIVKDRDGDPATTTDRRVLFDAPLASAPERLALGVLAPGARRTYEVTFTYVAHGGATATDNDNCFEGSVARERFGFDADERSAA